MASIRRTDKLHRQNRTALRSHFGFWKKCQTGKLDCHNYNQREGKVRVARHVFLASSFDRWRKLKATLKLKDSSLAWHLMEAHESECAACRFSDEIHGRAVGDCSVLEASLLSCVRDLFEFEDYIRVVGQLSVDFGGGRLTKLKFNANVKSESKEMKNSHTEHVSDFEFTSKNEVDKHTEKISKILMSPYESEKSSKNKVKLDSSHHLPFTGSKQTENSEVDTTIEMNSVNMISNTKSFNATTCSVESEVSSEIDIIGVDSSQEVNRIFEDTQIQEDCLSSADVTQEVHMETQSQVADNQADQISLENKPTLNNREREACSGLSLVSRDRQRYAKIDHETLSCVPSIKDSSTVIGTRELTNIRDVENGCALSPLQTCGELTPNEKALISTSLPGFSYTPDTPLDMTLLKTKFEGDHLPSRFDSQEGSRMYGHENRDGSPFLPQTSTPVNKRKAVTEGNDGVIESSPVPSKLPKCMEDKMVKLEESDNEESKRISNSIGKNSNCLTYDDSDRTEVKQANHFRSKINKTGQDHNEKGFVIHNGGDVGPYGGDDNQKLLSKVPLKIYNAVDTDGNTSSLNSSAQNDSDKTAFTSLAHNQSLSNSMGSGSSSIPWQRRDMSRKEEYEFLEMHPFCDLAEFSARHPHVHQRTYYRWKRRIKEEFMVLEQCPDMSFSQFSTVVLQAKESVFSLWKSLIAQGKGFFAPSDASKRHESKPNLTQASLNTQQQNFSEHAYLQKNLSASFIDFSQQFPGSSLALFNTLKQRSLQELSLFHQNKHMTYKDFSKLVAITEETFHEWQAGVQFLPQSLLSSLQALPISPSKQTSLDINGFHSKHHILNGLNSGSLKNSLLGQTGMPGHLNVPEPMASSLSASYFASLQSLMFPWPSYYGLNSQLPLMLWPGMIGGVAGGAGPSTGPLALLSHLHTASSGASSPASSLISGPHNTGVVSPITLESKHDCGKDTDSKDKFGNLSPVLKPLAENKSASVLKIPSSDKIHFAAHCQEEIQDGTSALGSPSRSRKQNLQEYVYYLHRPELGFRDLESLFPSISSRTFYRWRKEMHAAVLIIGDNPEIEFSNFQAIFPDIPEEIFRLWQQRAKQGEPLLKTSTNETLSEHFLDIVPEGKGQSPGTVPRFSPSPNLSHNSQLLARQSPHPPTLSDRTHQHQQPNSPFSKRERVTSTQAWRLSPASSLYSDDGTIPQGQNQGEDLTGQRKCHKEGYLYVQRNPSLDFASFSRQFPNISVRTFYRWKKELRDAVEFLRCNPTVDYEAYKTMDASISQEVFNLWKTVVNNNDLLEDNSNNDRSVSHAPLDENYNSALSYLHMNPTITYPEFIDLFPGVLEKTFNFWKEEMHRLRKYVQSNPSVPFSDIASCQPHISYNTFVLWKEMAHAGSKKADSSELRKNKAEPSKDFETLSDGHAFSYSAFETKAELKDNEESSVEYTKSQMTKAFVYLMYNPTITFNNYKMQFEFVTATTYELWLQKIRELVMDIISNPSMSYGEFNIRDMSPDLFTKLRSLGQEDLAQMEENCIEARATTQEPETSDQDGDIHATLRALIYLQSHPRASWTEFHMIHPNVPEEVFHSWISSITSQIKYVAENPDLTYSDFQKAFPHISEEIFDSWRSGESPSFLRTHMEHHFLGISQDEKAMNLKSKRKTSNSQSTDRISPQKQFEEVSKLNSDGESLKALDKPIKLVKTSKESCNDELACTFHLPNGTQIQNNSQLAHTMIVSKTKQEHIDKELPNFLDNDDHKVSSASLFTNFEGASSISIQPKVKSPKLDHLQVIDSCHDPDFKQSFCHQPADSEANDIMFRPTPDLGSSSSSSSSLSALMSLASGTNPENPHLQTATTTATKLSNQRYPWPTQTQQSLSSQMGEQLAGGGSARDDDEAFSSQRQKKMSRAEYMFVKANPEVDSQEFSRIFPGVSARTFYRWKKEIRAQLQMS